MIILVDLRAAVEQRTSNVCAARSIQATGKKEVTYASETKYLQNCNNNPSWGKFELEAMRNCQNSQARRGCDHGIPCQEISTAILLCLGNVEDLILNTRHGLACDWIFFSWLLIFFLFFYTVETNVELHKANLPIPQIVPNKYMDITKSHPLVQFIKSWEFHFKKKSYKISRIPFSRKPWLMIMEHLLVCCAWNIF